MTNKFLATGIGSMPQKEPSEALDLIFRYFPCIPFWPQLPKRDPREGMIMQFSAGFPFLKTSPFGICYDRRNNEKTLEEFYGRIIQEDLDYFKIEPEFASGLYYFYEKLKTAKDLKDIIYLKGQLSGPFTFSAGIKDEEGNLVINDQVFIEAITKGLIYKALWQIKFLKEFKKKIIIFFDEPYLSCFGSAYTPINREKIVQVLSEIFSEIKNFAINKLLLTPQELYLGVHCCGNTDWSIFTQITDLDIISFDAFSFADKVALYSKDLKKFLKRKGILAWGLIPTLEFSGKEDLDFILNKFHSVLNLFINKGIEKELLLNRLILTPACGLGNVSEANALKILELLSKLRDSLIFA